MHLKMASRKRDIVLVLVLELTFFIGFCIFARYSKNADAATDPQNIDQHDMHHYPMFQDVHVMIFIGFGFLMTFLRRYGYSSVGFNFLLASLMVQWAILSNGFYNLDSDYKIRISVVTLLQADIAAAAVLISMGAVLGQTTYVQLLVMGTIEIAVFSVNLWLGSSVFKVADAGASIFVHAFGAYFGLAVSYVLNKSRKDSGNDENSLEEASYTSDLFAMIGTVFLWIFWPSFNAAEVSGDSQHRAVINTYLSLAACCVTSFALSAAVTPGRKLDMVHIQNSTLAGGVAVGTASNMMIQPYGAISIGIIAGVISVCGYRFLTPALNKKGIHDTCGVHNLHGMPAVLAALFGALMAAMASEDIYHLRLYDVFPARAPEILPAELAVLGTYEPGDGRTAMVQAGYQLLALVVTIVIALVSGTLTGFFILGPLTTGVSSPHHYNDALLWHVPDCDERSHDKIEIQSQH